jgi:hypothetical protein
MLGALGALGLLCPMLGAIGRKRIASDTIRPRAFRVARCQDPRRGQLGMHRARALAREP